MLFTGYAELTIDAKGRLAIPAKYRNKWDPARDGGAWYCLAWPGGTLRLYTEATFERLAERLGETQPVFDGEDVSIDSVLFSAAERLEMDTAGRIMLPKQHMKMTQMPGEVVVVGARNRLEVYPRQRWEENQDAMFRQMPDLIRQAERRSPGG